MQIRHLSKLIYDESEDYNLQNSDVVIDGQNFFYNSYAASGLQSMLGCESDKYAAYLRRYLRSFKDANVKCYIFFKGGHEDPSKIWNRKYRNYNNRNDNSVTPPIFMKDIYKQVLEEMNFDYVVCQFEAKRECVAFAQKRKCPIISNDIEFCFSGVLYIPVRGELNISQCKLFNLDNFMRKFNLNDEKLAIFILLTDERIFPNNYFRNFMQAMGIPNWNRNTAIFKWLSGVDSNIALNRILRYVEQTDRQTFLMKNAEIKAFIRRQENPGLPSQYLENQFILQFMENDPQWFEKGVVTQAIAIPYINLYRSHIIQGSWSFSDNDPSLDIVKYAFGLLCGFGEKEFKFVREALAGDLESTTIEISNLKKPNYTAVECPFENGWNQVHSFDLFGHFLRETLPMFDYTILERLPEDARLLSIALVYFSSRKPGSTINEVCSVLLSYLVLNVLTNVECRDPVDIGLAGHPELDVPTDQDAILYQDKVVARRNLAEYLDDFPEVHAAAIYDRQRIHSVMEFQRCLEHLNYLNRLCGRPYQPTDYSKTYNGTLVYRVLFSLEQHALETLTFFENKFNQAPTVLAFWNRLIRLHR